MRKTTITCDVCNAPADKFLCSVTINGTVTADACSTRCQARLLRSFADDLEKKDGKKVADNAKFAAENPGAAVTSGCAACAVGVPLTVENAFRHTGEGANCKKMKEQGPCLCPPENWKSVPADSSTPGPREVTCQKCGNVWTAEVRSAASTPTETTGETAPRARRGRPPGSGKKAETNGAGPAADELARLKAKRDQEAANAGALRGPGSAFSPEGPLFPVPAPAPPVPAPEAPKLNRDMTVSESPRWCGCGSPLVFSRADATDLLGKWECSKDKSHQLMHLSVRDGQPGENLSQTVTDAAKHGVKLDLKDFAQWPVMKRITLAEWIRQGAKVEDRPEFLGPPPPPPVSAPAPAASRFAF